MKRRWNLCQILGMILVLISLSLLLGTQLMEKIHRKKTDHLTMQLVSLLPDRTEGTPGAYSVADMPVLQLENREFIGIIEFPAYGITLPVGNQWDQRLASRYPCRFWGSCYDSSLVIGGKDQKGQFEFFDRMEYDDAVILTDMTGTRFSYRVARIQRSKDASAERLMEAQWDLTLYSRGTASLEYVIIRCMLAP